MHIELHIVEVRKDICGVAEEERDPDWTATAGKQTVAERHEGNKASDRPELEGFRIEIAEKNEKRNL